MAELLIKERASLRDLQDYVEQMMNKRNFDRSIEHLPKRFMLLMEEVGELAKAARKTVGMKTAADSSSRQSVQDEAADVFIVLLGICNVLGIDLEQALRNKEEKNKKRTWS